MRASTDRILTTHVGALPMPPGLWSKQGVEEARLQREVAEVVRMQGEAGIDIINEGELTKGGNWVSFINERLSGFVPVDNGATSALLMQSEDWKQFKDFYQAALAGGTLFESTRSVAEQIRELDWSCTSAITYVGQKYLQQEIECLRAALGSTPTADAFLTSTAPASLEPGRGVASQQDVKLTATRPERCFVEFGDRGQWIFAARSSSRRDPRRIPGSATPAWRGGRA